MSALVTLATVWFAYEFIAIFWFGATIGKRVAGLRVVDNATGDDVDMINAALRWVLPGATLLLPAGSLLFALVCILDLLLLDTPRGRGLADRLARTRVISSR